jgi:DNA-binding transcriptional MerR regulator
VVVVEWLKLSEICNATGTPESTGRRWIVEFSVYAQRKKQGRGVVYAPDTTNLINRIKSLYETGYSTDEIHQILSGSTNKVIDIVDTLQKNTSAGMVDNDHIARLVSVMEIFITQKKEIEKIQDQMRKKDEKIAELEKIIFGVNEIFGKEKYNLEKRFSEIEKNLREKEIETQKKIEKIEDMIPKPQETLTIWQAFKKMLKLQKKRLL